MSSHVNSLKKQIELLQGEIELYANVVDRLATQLAEKEAQLHVATTPAAIDTSDMSLATERETAEPGLAG